MVDTPVYNHLFAGLTAVCQCLCCTEGPQYCTCVSPVLSGKDHLPWPAGNALPEAAWGTVGHMQGHVAVLCSTWCPWGSPRAFSAKLLSNQLASSTHWCMGLFVSRCRTLHFPLWSSLRFLFACISTRWCSRWCISHSSKVCIIYKLAIIIPWISFPSSWKLWSLLTSTCCSLLGDLARKEPFSYCPSLSERPQTPQQLLTCRAASSAGISIWTGMVDARRNV